MSRNRIRGWLWGAALDALWPARRAAGFDGRFATILRGGTVYDGSGSPGYRADVGIARGRIAAIGDLSGARARDDIEVRGQAIAPGFINTLSWATESIIADPNSESDIRQGVTLEIFGEGLSMGPLNPAMKLELQSRQHDLTFPVDWTTLGEYLEFLERRGVACNVASFVGATTLRIHELGFEHREASAAELARMCDLARAAMREGALGLGSALIYAPASSATTAELTALARAVAEYGGAYFTHLRSETTGWLAAIDEAIEIARAAGCHTEIWHLKAAGAGAWPHWEQAIKRIESARSEGVSLSANMYPYAAGASGLDAAMPPWVQEGGHDAWLARLRDPSLRQRLLADMRQSAPEWESLYAAAGSAEQVLLLGFRDPALRHHTGQTLAAVAAERALSPEECMIELVLEDNSRVNAAFFMMSEANIRRQLVLPWMGICSDAESLSPRGKFLNHRPHPRAYGSFARFLGKYVRDCALLTLPEAIRRVTSMPAQQLRLHDRGSLQLGSFADVVVFDAQRIADHATFEQPHQFATGVSQVFVNGVAVLRDGRTTGARPGRFVRGPGWNQAREHVEASGNLPRAAG